MINFSSNKRSYDIFLSDKHFNLCVEECSKMSDHQLQNFIDECSIISSKLGSSRKTGAWKEGKKYKEKMKIAIIIRDRRN